MRALVVQPPFTQLNSPYPAAYYLQSFLRSRGVDATTVDHSIELYRALFSVKGLAPAFAAARRIVEAGAVRGAPADPASLAQLERYLSYEALYLEWVDGLVGFLSGVDPAFAHRLAQAVELPRGMRAEAYLEAHGGRITARESRALATSLLEDLGDLVSYAYDPSFETVRYGERIAASASRFAPVRAALEASPLLDTHYRELLDSEWDRNPPPDLLLLSIPFPGCLLGALACARSARARFGPRLRVLFGGGYVSTELRGLEDGGIFDFCDYLCFDAGYGSIDSILEVESGAPRERLYKTMYRSPEGVVVAGLDPSDYGAAPDGCRSSPCDQAEKLRGSELAALASIAPDYEGCDFGRYLQFEDSENPMHALWSDSPWLKYQLARGCYWARCSFCDTRLDYVSLFVPSEVGALMAAADEASLRSGLHGIHFADEAMPMASLLAFARENRSRARAGKRPFYFWGNVRFDASWTEDRCEYLAASGLVAVSGGIEIATEAGLAMTDKGFDLRGLVRCLAAMKHGGLLVHAYLIYGFPGQTRRDIADSSEVCRRLFAAGLVDSAFWHRFVLTRHSRMYGERLESWPELRPIDRPWDFANNDLGFEGEKEFDQFDGPLATSLERWMRGEGLDDPPGGEADETDRLILEAESRLGSARGSPKGRAHWIAGLPTAGSIGRQSSRLAWTYRGESRELALSAGTAAEAARTIADLASRIDGRPYPEVEAELSRLPGMKQAAILELRSSGLVVL